MRWVAAMAPILLLATRVHADARIDQIVKGYEHEQTSCKIHEGGVAKMLDGATMLLERGHEDGLAEDVKSLHAAHEAVASYCTALATTIDFLKGDSSASYKSLEKEIGARDNHIRSLRTQSKKALDDTEPLIQRWIPKINAARIETDKSAVPKATPTPKPPDKQPDVPALKPETKPLPPPPPPPEPRREEPVLKSQPKPEPPADATPVSAKFPSGRAIKLPQLGGKWEVRGDTATDVAEYIEGITHTSVVAEAMAGVSCTSQLARLQSKAYGRQAVKEQARSGVAWRVSLPGDSSAIVACASTRTGSAIVTFDAPDASHPDLSDIAWQMLASLAK
jgi:hypothetical protein